MTPKEYLNQAKNIDRRIAVKKERAAYLEALATKTTRALSIMPGNSSKDPHKTEGAICDLVDLKEELCCDVNNLVALQIKIDKTINSVKDEDERNVLELRYLCFKTWEEIADIMGYTVRGVYKIHNKALKKLKLFTPVHAGSC